MEQMAEVGFPFIHSIHPSLSSLSGITIIYYNNFLLIYISHVSFYALLRYEETNPEELAPAAHKDMMLLVYDQCLCCLRHHPEVWLGLARYQLKASGVSEARIVYKEAIEVIPTVYMLRLALAELEECQGNIDSARDILRLAFQQLPSAWSFSIYQRFVRRHDGLTSARRCFSDTFPLRVDKSLGYEVCELSHMFKYFYIYIAMISYLAHIFCLFNLQCLKLYLAHAQLELDVNVEPTIALRIMEMARTVHPQAHLEMPYVRLAARLLIQLGDMKKLSWLFHTALQDPVSATGSGDTSGSNADSNNPKKMSSLSLREKAELWDLYLETEMKLGLSTPPRLDELRARRNKARLSAEEAERGGNKATFVVSPEDRLFVSSTGIYESVLELFERYAVLTPMLPPHDLWLKERAEAALLLCSDGGQRFDDDRPTIGDGGVISSRKKKDKDLAEKNKAEMVYVDIDGGPIPDFIRDLISRLPQYTGQPYDAEATVDQLRRAVLPPRPPEEISATSNEGPDSKQSRKRERVGGAYYDNDDGDESADDTLDKEPAFDIFRQRQRMKIQA